MESQDTMENIHRLTYHCSKVGGESRYVMESLLSIPIITDFIRGRDPISRYLESLLGPELACHSLVRKVLLDLLEERSFIDHENQESLFKCHTRKKRYSISPRSGF